VLIWAAFLSYAGPFGPGDRQQLVDSWMTLFRQQNVPHTDDNSHIVDAMTSANTVRATVIFSVSTIC